MKARPYSQASIEHHTKGKRFNTKGYFFNIEPHCEQYLKVKHAIYQKSKKLRQAKNQGKQNNPVLFQFNKPKSGFYQLKGCKIQKNNQIFNKQSNESRVQKQQNKGKQYLNYFLKKYSERKLKKNNNQQSQNLLPVVKIIQPYSYPLAPIDCQSSLHNLSIGIGLIPRTQVIKPPIKKLRTQPIAEKRRNKSCQLLPRKQNSMQSQISNISVTKLFS